MNPIAAPQVVDLDGTLTPTDIGLFENNALNALNLPFWLLSGRAAFKESIASRAPFAAEQLSYRKPFMAYLNSDKKNGQRIILATAAHRVIAEAVTTHLGLFDVVLPPTGREPKGRSQAGDHQGDNRRPIRLSGDSASDMPIWMAAEGAILVGASAHSATILHGKVIVRECEMWRRRLAACFSRPPMTEELAALGAPVGRIRLLGHGQAGDDRARLSCFLPRRVRDVSA